MNITLISLYDKIALGIRSISSYLKMHGHTTSIIYFKDYRQVRCDRIRDMPPSGLHIQIKEDGRYALGYPQPPTDREYMLLTILLKELRPELIGISLTYLHRHIAREISIRIKRELPIPIIWGGVEPTIFPEDSLKYADMVLRGEGEEAMLELANRISNGEKIRDIQNIWIRCGNNIIQNPLRPLIRNLDTLPFIDISPSNKYSIDEENIKRGEKSLSNDPYREKYEIMTNRGCMYHCTYCVNNQLKKLYRNGQYLRQRSVSHVIEELAAAKEERPIEFIEFQDDIFPWQREWIKEFSQIYSERIKIPFCCYLHPNHVDSKNLMALKKSGLHHAVIGIQSGSDHILQEIFRRPTSAKKVIDAGKKLRQMDIFVYFDIITENPFEREEDCRDTLNLLLNIPTPFGLNVSRLSLFPGTEIDKMARQRCAGGNSGKAAPGFWSALYLLSSQRFIPRFIISLFSRSRFLKYNPQYLEFILRLYMCMRRIREKAL